MRDYLNQFLNYYFIIMRCWLVKWNFVASRRLKVFLQLWHSYRRVDLAVHSVERCLYKLLLRCLKLFPQRLHKKSLLIAAVSSAKSYIVKNVLQDCYACCLRSYRKLSVKLDFVMKKELAKLLFNMKSEQFQC